LFNLFWIIFNIYDPWNDKWVFDKVENNWEQVNIIEDTKDVANSMSNNIYNDLEIVAKNWKLNLLSYIEWVECDRLIDTWTVYFYCDIIDDSKYRESKNYIDEVFKYEKSNWDLMYLWNNNSHAVLEEEKNLLKIIIDKYKSSTDTDYMYKNELMYHLNKQVVTNIKLKWPVSNYKYNISSQIWKLYKDYYYMEIKWWFKNWNEYIYVEPIHEHRLWIEWENYWDWDWDKHDEHNEDITIPKPTINGYIMINNYPYDIYYYINWEEVMFIYRIPERDILYFWELELPKI